MRAPSASPQANQLGVKAPSASPQANQLGVKAPSASPRANQLGVKACVRATADLGLRERLSWKNETGTRLPRTTDSPVA